MYNLVDKWIYITKWMDWKSKKLINDCTSTRPTNIILHWLVKIIDQSNLRCSYIYIFDNVRQGACIYMSKQFAIITSPWMAL